MTSRSRALGQRIRSTSSAAGYNHVKPRFEGRLDFAPAVRVEGEGGSATSSCPTSTRRTCAC